MSTVLVIDDSVEFTEMIGRHLTRRGYAVRAAHSGAAGIRLAIEHRPRVILLDLHLSDMSGLDVLSRVKPALPDVEIVIVTGHPELGSALAAIKRHVRDYLCKPFSIEELETVLRGIFAAAPAAPATPPAPAREPDAGGEVEMVGTSAATIAVRGLIRRLAETGVRAALITGESGTGKDLAARLFHAAGPRRAGPFVEVNCSAVSESLFESEFFGHERGAFTGAIASRRGFAELADGGTLFLDEIGDIPLSCQPKLLRFLEDQSFVRVGGGRKIKVDVQIVAATNRDLRAMVSQWTFRQDLYFRLNVVPIELPPLRERREDILPVACYWLERANARYGRAVAGFTPDTEALLLAQPWPGNVREIRNLVERLVILAAGGLIEARQLPPEYLAFPPAPAVTGAAPATPEVDSLEEVERLHIRKVLARVSGNKTRAAEILGITRQTLRAKIGTAV